MKADNINNIIKVINSGKIFYQDASEKVANSGLAMVFRSMAETREKALLKLQPFATLADGEQEFGDAWAVRMREFYTDLIAIVSLDPDHTYIAQLEKVESKTLMEISAALDQASQPIYAAALREVHSEIKLCQSRMSNLESITG